LLLPLISLTLLLSACLKDKNSDTTDILGEFNEKTIQHDGVERAYNIYLPKNFDNSRQTPLVIALHGGGGTASRFEDDVSAGSLTTAAEERGVILLTPDGIDKRWNDGRTEHFGSDPMYDDLGFISTLIDLMVQDYNVDSDRVYVTGISNGGFMSISSVTRS